MKLCIIEREETAHVTQPVDMKCLKNLVNKNRAPFSVIDGAICFGLLGGETISFPNRLCAAAIPACL